MSATADGSAAVPDYVSSWKDDEVRALSELADKFLAAEVTAASRHAGTSQQYVDRDVWRRGRRARPAVLLDPRASTAAAAARSPTTSPCSRAQAPGAVTPASGNACTAASSRTTSSPTAPRSRSSAGCPGWPAGEMIAAIAMTEPGAGSDLKSITHHAPSATATTTSSTAPRRSSPTARTADLIVRRGQDRPDGRRQGHLAARASRPPTAPGFVRGRILDKVGQHGADTSELFFDDVRVPAANLLGGVEGHGFGQLMTQLAHERLIDRRSAAVAAHGSAPSTETVAYTKDAQRVRSEHRSTSRTPRSRSPSAPTHGARRRGCFVDSLHRSATCDGELDATTASMAQVVAHRTAVPGRRPLPAAVRRLRLHARVPDRADVRRRPRARRSTAAPTRS